MSKVIETVDFSQSPFIVIWEMTRSCALKCVHCRAEAVESRDPRELDGRQACALLEEIRHFGRPLVVLTGGDPMESDPYCVYVPKAYRSVTSVTGIV